MSSARELWETIKRFRKLVGKAVEELAEEELCAEPEGFKKLGLYDEVKNTLRRVQELATELECKRTASLAASLLEGFVRDEQKLCVCDYCDLLEAFTEDIIEAFDEAREVAGAGNT